MNAVTTTRPGPPAPAAPQASTRANTVEALLRKTDAVYLRPFRDANAVFDMSKGWRGNGDGYQALWDKLPCQRSPRLAEVAAHRLERLDEAALTKIRESLVAAVADAPEPKAIRAMLALLVDAFPNARPHSPEGYFETLAHDVIAEGYSAAVVAEACRVTRREQRFLPTIAELLEACAKALKNLEIALRAADRGLGLVFNARMVLAIEPTQPKEEGASE